MVPLADRELEAIRRSGHLCLNVSERTWDSARGYLFDEANQTLYFPVAKKYLVPDPSRYQVLIWGEPKVLVTGHLRPATSDDDTRVQLELAAGAGMEETKAHLMLLDQRNLRPRKTRYKLIIGGAEILPD